MIKRIKLFTGSILIISTIAIFSHAIKNKSTKRPVYTLQVFKFQNGWGYDILKNNSTFIHQVYIPVIEGNTMFFDKKSAELTGRLVIKKIKKKKTPYVSREELIKLRVIKKK